MDKERELEQLIAEYDALHGVGSGHEVMGGLMFSHGYSGIARVFKKAKGRKIIVETPEDLIDGVVVKYKKVIPNEKA